MRWLNILSKLISLIFSRYFIMTLRTLGSGRMIFLLALAAGVHLLFSMAIR